MSRASNGPTRTAMQIFRVPLLLAVASVAGLLSALLGDDLWDMFSWITLVIPIVAIAWALWDGRR